MMQNSQPICISVSKWNQATVWKKGDILKLKKIYRIPGNFIGSLPRKPWQNQVMSIPLLLMPEEVTLLLQKGLAVLRTEADSLQMRPSEDVDKFAALREKSHLDQIKIFVEEREDKKRRLDNRLKDNQCEKESNYLSVGESASLKSAKTVETGSVRKANSQNDAKRDLIETELTVHESDDGISDSKSNDSQSKLFEVDKEDLKYYSKSTWVHLPTASVHDDDSQDVAKTLHINSNWAFPETEKERMSYNVYSDLWEKGYFLTSGEKFGCDFLVYPGEPARFHSQFIVIVMSSSKEISALELLAYGRLGTNVKKTVVFAIVDAAKDYFVKYHSLSWTGIE